MKALWSSALLAAGAFTVGLAAGGCGRSSNRMSPTPEPHPVVGGALQLGQRIPELRSVDQFGKDRDFQDLKGPQGLIILFFRSADW